MDEGGSEAPARIRARLGELFSVELPANPTAGYWWRAEFAKDRLDLVEHEHRPARVAPGSTGVERFVFLARARGESRIRFTYGRSWEPSPIEERVTLVEVE